MNKETEEKLVREGSRIPLFTFFPINQIPEEKAIKFTLLSSTERYSFESKVTSFSMWGPLNKETWEVIDKFIVVWLAEWYLVRILC